MDASLRTEWDLSPLLAGDEDPKIGEYKEAVSAAVGHFVSTWKERTDYLSDASALRQALDDFERLSREYGTSGPLGYYFDLRTAQNQADPLVSAGHGLSEEFDTETGNQLSFFELRLAALPAEKLRELAESQELKPYRHFLERLAAAAPYLLSEAEEKVLALKSSTSYGNWVGLTARLLSSELREVAGEDGTVTPQGMEALMSLLASQQKPVRDEAAAALNDIFSKLLVVAEVELNSVLAHKKVNDVLRGYSRPDLSRHLSDDIDTDVVDTLIEAVGSRFDISHRYYALKARLLGQATLAYHERNVEYGTLTDKYPYPEAISLVERVFAGLNPQFAELFRGFVRNGQLDVYPRPGKRGGAFCAHGLLSQPTFILLNHTDSLNDVLTMAHEAGHGINNELIRLKHHALDFGTPISTAEVASTFMEDFVLEALMEDADDEKRLSLVMMKLNSDVSTIFRQVACYRFEKELHAEFRKKGYLDSQALGALFQTHMAAYMGPAVDQSEGSENWWAYWSHIRSFFYVYSYASGLLISKSLQKSVAEDSGFIVKVKEFLATGHSASPRSAFVALGVDIADRAFWDAGLERIEKALREAEKLATKLKR